MALISTMIHVAGCRRKRGFGSHDHTGLTNLSLYLESHSLMMAQEIFFLHERGKGLMIQNAVQTILAAVWVLFASPISGAISPQGWYYLDAGLSGLQLVLSIFLVPETKYRRSMAAFQETTTVSESNEGHVTKAGELKKDQEATHCSVRPPLDFERFEPRTWKSDMRLWVGTPEWRLAFDTLRVRGTIPTCLSTPYANLSYRAPLSFSSSLTSSGLCASTA